jgi:hypothetical protein
VIGPCHSGAILTLSSLDVSAALQQAITSCRQRERCTESSRFPNCSRRNHCRWSSSKIRWSWSLFHGGGHVVGGNCGGRAVGLEDDPFGGSNHIQVRNHRTRQFQTGNRKTEQQKNKQM